MERSRSRPGSAPRDTTGHMPRPGAAPATPVRAVDTSDTSDTSDAVDTAGLVLRPGDRGEAVKLLQQRLHAGRYYFGKINGVYDEQTKFAVWALQKSRRIMPQGEVGSRVWTALERRSRRKPLVPTGGADRVEIDLRNQLLTVYRDRRPALISHISTGAEVHYCENGHCGNAITPVGDFRVSRRAPGWTTGRLGTMFNSLYFVGGIAMHGSTKVPLRPASHGCVRVPLATSKRLYEMVRIGEPVYVRGKII